MELNEALKIVKESGYEVNEAVYQNVFNLNKKIKEYLENDKFIVVLLLGMYGRQESSEKMARQTRFKNFRGFNQTDAGNLSFLAEKIENGEVLSRQELNFAKRRLQTYKNTQWLDVLTEMGYIEQKPLPGRKIEYHFNESNFENATGVSLSTIVPDAEKDFVAKAISLAETDNGMIDDDDLAYAKKIATELFYTGLISPQDAADRINDEL